MVSGLVHPARTLRGTQLRAHLPRRARGNLRVHLPLSRRFTAGPGPLKWWRELLLVGGLYAVYEASRGVDDSSLPAAIGNGRGILSWEQAWHLAPEHWLNQVFAHATPLAVIASYYYSVLHYVVTPAVLIWMFRSHAAHYRFARTSLAISTVLGLLGFYLVPTAPPRLLPGSGMHDTLADVSNWGWWSGDGSVPRGLGGLSNQFAAMPSLHVGWSLWCGVLLVMYAKHRWVRWAGAAYPIATTLVVLGTGNHYLLDTVAGAATMGVGAGLTWLLRHWGTAKVHVRIAMAHGPAALALRSPSAIPSLTAAARTAAVPPNHERIDVGDYCIRS